MNNSLFIGATHGDEPNGVSVLQKLSKQRSDFDWIIGNPKAFERNQRSFEGDLNRSAPGSLDAPTYAARRAAEIIAKSQNYTFTIDLHGSSKQVGNFIILTRLTNQNLALACQFNIQRIVYWPAFSGELQGPLSEYVPCGLEIESGPKDDIQVQNELLEILQDFLDKQKQNHVLDWNQEIQKKDVFEVYGSLHELPNVPLTEFSEVQIEDETFYPLLINSYLKRTGIVCYKMNKQVDISQHKDLR